MLRLFKSIAEIRSTVKFPAYENFFSELKQTNISVDTYNAAKRMYETRLALPEAIQHPHKWHNMGDYLKHYNMRDTVPLVLALQNCFRNYEKYFEIDPGTKLSLPSISFAAMYRLADQSLPYVSTFSNTEHGNAVRSHFRNNVIGGVSIVFHR